MWRMRIFKPISPAWSGGYSRLPCHPPRDTPSPATPPLDASPPVDFLKFTKLTPASLQRDFPLVEGVSRPRSPGRDIKLMEEVGHFAYFLERDAWDARSYVPRKRFMIGCRMCRSAARWLRCGRIKVHYIQQRQVVCSLEFTCRNFAYIFSFFCMVVCVCVREWEFIWSTFISCFLFADQYSLKYKRWKYATGDIAMAIIHLLTD